MQANVQNGPLNYEQDAKIIYATGGGAFGHRRHYKKYEHGHFVITQHRPTPMTDVSKTCMHLLMLGMPTRVNCDKWLEFYGAESLMQLAMWMLPQSILNTIVIIEQSDFGMEEHLELNAEQDAMVNSLVTVIMLQCNIVHGPAGTGKSTILKALQNWMIAGGTFEPIVLTLTGVAAVNVGGQTIHSFFGAKANKGTMKLEPNLFEMDWHIHCI